MACTLTLMPFRPLARLSSVSAATSLSSSLSMCSGSCNGCRAEKFPSRAVLEIVRRSTQEFLRCRADHYGPRIPRESSNPSSSPAMTEFMFSRMVLNIFMHPAQCVSDLSNLSGSLDPIHRRFLRSLAIPKMARRIVPRRCGPTARRYLAKGARVALLTMAAKHRGNHQRKERDRPGGPQARRDFTHQQTDMCVETLCESCLYSSVGMLVKRESELAYSVSGTA